MLVRQLHLANEQVCACVLSLCSFCLDLMLVAVFARFCIVQLCSLSQNNFLSTKCIPLILLVHLVCLCILSSIQVNKIRDKCQKQEDTIHEMEGEVDSKRGELQKLKDEETSLEREYESNKHELDNVSHSLQDTKLQISQVSVYYASDSFVILLC